MIQPVLFQWLPNKTTRRFLGGINDAVLRNSKMVMGKGLNYLLQTTVVWRISKKSSILNFAVMCFRTNWNLIVRVEEIKLRIDATVLSFDM